MLFQANNVFPGQIMALHLKVPISTKLPLILPTEQRKVSTGLCMVQMWDAVFVPRTKCKIWGITLKMIMLQVLVVGLVEGKG